MDSETETLEERLKSFLGHLQAECGIFERIVYKNKNQHRRCTYFQYLLKVRRDLRLLQSAKLDEILASCFQVIAGKRPKKKVHLLESLKRRRCEDGAHNFMEQLLGAARLLSQMVEPMLKAATEVSTLLARSFFMGFSVTVLALLARLRVLVQQILLDVVSVYNIVSSLSRKKQSVKINQEGIEVFREVYPTNEDFITLECVWKADKFILLERKHKGEINNQDEGNKGDDSTADLAVHYQTFESFLGDDEHTPMKTDADYATKEGSISVEENNTDLLATPSVEKKGKQLDDSLKKVDEFHLAGNPGQSHPSEDALHKTSSSSMSLNRIGQKSGARKVAFLSVNKPTPSTTTVTDVAVKGTEDKSGDKNDPFYALFSAGTMKDSLF